MTLGKQAGINTGGEGNRRAEYTGFPQLKQLSEGPRLTHVQSLRCLIGWQMIHPSGFHQCPGAPSLSDWEALFASCFLGSMLGWLHTAPALNRSPDPHRPSLSGTG